MNLVSHSVNQAISQGNKKPIKHPLMYLGYIIKCKKTLKGYKLQAYSFKTDIFLNPLYNSFEDLKPIIDNLKS